MDEHNCPNCGAVIHDCICDYCGTVFQSSTDAFIGRECVLMTMDDDGNMHVTGLRLHRMEYKEPEPVCFYTFNMPYLTYQHTREVIVEGTVDDLFTKTSWMRKLGNVLVERFSNETE